MIRLVLFLALAGLPLAAHAGPIVVTPDVCAAITAHEPADDVAYKPGVDVSGKPVAPADLNDAGRLDYPADHEFWIALEVPLRDQIDIDPDSNLDRIGGSNIDAGTVTVRNGEVFFNGRPLGSQRTHAIAEECARRQAESAAHADGPPMPLYNPFRAADDQ